MTERIDRGGLGDIDAMVGVMAAAFDPRFGEAWTGDQLTGALAVPDTWAHLARDGVGAVGFALVRRILDEAELMLVAVRPDRRGAGVGARLVAEVGAAAAARGARRMFLEVRANNSCAIRLYARTGFAEVGRRRDYYLGVSGERFDAITMRRALPFDS